LEFAKVALQGLAKRTENECFAADARTRQVVMQVNVAAAKLQATKIIEGCATSQLTGKGSCSSPILAIGAATEGRRSSARFVVGQGL
jgi:hypothetical protein